MGKLSGPTATAISVFFPGTGPSVHLAAAVPAGPVRTSAGAAGETVPPPAVTVAVAVSVIEVPSSSACGPPLMMIDASLIGGGGGGTMSPAQLAPTSTPDAAAATAMIRAHGEE